MSPLFLSPLHAVLQTRLPEPAISDLQLGLLLPILFLLGGACIGVLVEALAPREARHGLQVGLTLITIVAALVATVMNWSAGVGGLAGLGSIMVDGPAYFSWAALLIFGGLAVLLMAEKKVYHGVSAFASNAAAPPGSPTEREATAARIELTEVYPLVLFALSGMLMFPAANDLVTMFIAMEVLSFPLYILSAMARRRRLLSQEAAMKYFLLGALSSGFFVYGMALTYGYAGSLDFAAIAAAAALPESDGMILAGMALMGAALMFKVGAVPFHSWTPDVYQGAPTPVTGFMAICTKFAAMIALLRLFFVAFGGYRWDWQIMLAVVAVASMLIGSIMAIVQTDMKRLLAYSSVAHAGFLMTAVVGASVAEEGSVAQLGSVSSVLFYLVTYGFATLGAFAIVTMVREGNGSEATRLDQWAGLGRRSPLVAGIFTVLMLSFAGIPLTAGFMGKWAVFAAAWSGGYAWLVVVAVLVSVVAAFIYLKVVVAMWFSDPEGEVGEVVVPGWGTAVTLGIGLVATLVLGVVPGPVLELAAQAGGFLR
ncbi:NADH-quinone oxidoreductase subunit NuoN [Parenemella sanctibonifatiensis]|uniref:NADH-quinone oxidoreductase subunit N n=1 Tax=Parenemella sanctibonifatiensis TaxID=2016505 RepID=A0A255EHR1_9ACTN|nr:NADH-quinone oxidoreductase subunit NuoN [Parenemella sanctibonifatiensis]OYN88972.1 NADH-quinone oxidoreductase subunit N [Parenemella sanctibonifatiensis]